MSHYLDIKTKMTDTKSLVTALKRMGFQDHMIEVHDKAQNLYGYHGDLRAQKANIIIRRKYVGRASNDIGYEKVDGYYVARISEYDSQMKIGNKDWQKQVISYYGVERAKKSAAAKGYKFYESMDNQNRPKLRILL